MKVVALCILAAAFLCGVSGKFTHPDKTYKILMVFPFASKSHKNMMMAVAEALADRGHKVRRTIFTAKKHWLIIICLIYLLTQHFHEQVVVLSSFQQLSKNPNISEISLKLPTASDGILPMFEKRRDGIAGLTVMETILPAMAKEFYKIPTVKELYEKRKNFDLIVINQLFNEVGKGLQDITILKITGLIRP